MIFLIEICLAAGFFVFAEFAVALFEETAVALRGYAYIFLVSRRAVAGKGKDIGFVLDSRVDDVRYLIYIDTGYGGHYDAADTGTLDTSDLLQSGVEAARFSEPVVGLPHAVQRKLILLTAVFFELLTYPVVEMERISHYGERNLMFLHKGKKLPEIRM